MRGIYAFTAGLLPLCALGGGFSSISDLEDLDHPQGLLRGKTKHHHDEEFRQTLEVVANELQANCLKSLVERRELSEDRGGAEERAALQVLARYASFRRRFPNPVRPKGQVVGTLGSFNHEPVSNTSSLCQRILIFRENEAFAAALNADREDKAEYSAEHSPFGDLSAEEFASIFLQQELRPASGLGDIAYSSLTSSAYPLIQQTSSSLFEEDDVDIDWTKNDGVVSPVRDQGTLGTCYAFSAAGSVEGQLALSKGLFNVSVSVEHSLECNAVSDDGNDDAVCGEFGGWPRLVFDFWRQAGGVVRDDDWPYCAGILDKKTSLPLCFPCMAAKYDESSCGDHDDFYCNASSTFGQVPHGGRCNDGGQWIRKNRIGDIRGWDHESQDEVSLATRLAEHGPLSATIDARSLQLYRRGIANPRLCSSKIFNHSVLLVGAGGGSQTSTATSKKEQPFWKVKASWGSSWGEQGFFRLLRGQGKCGINKQVVSVTLI